MQFLVLFVLAFVLALTSGASAVSVSERLAHLQAGAKAPKKLVPITVEASKELDILSKTAGTDKDINLPAPVPTTPQEFQYVWPPRPKMLYPMTPQEQALALEESTPYRDVSQAIKHENFIVPASTKPVTPKQAQAAADKMRHLRIKLANAYSLDSHTIDNLLTL